MTKEIELHINSLILESGKKLFINYDTTLKYFVLRDYLFTKELTKMFMGTLTIIIRIENEW